MSGAYAVLDASGAIVEVGDLPLIGTGTQRRIDAANLAAIVRRLSPERSILEAVNAMPGQGVSSMFRFGQSLGTVAGVLGACSVPVQWVTPAKWKREAGIGADKEVGRQRAIETWPAHATTFARKKDHGRAEAALMALWGIRNDR
ncbi:hypothetical protein [Chthonobacter albigriseus]|uniref:hypothetical protein n=1 Tax=Chthonobacter albigriseus TaxID=1683161 RepID=UPI0018887F0B|nr:hypothetical protein [Chthonobacter albigriseus]